MTEIILNCLIVPIGKLMNIPYIKVMQLIIISISGDITELQIAIQSRLEASFNNISLKFCIIQTKINMYNEIFKFFTKKSKVEYFYITIYFWSE